MINNLLSIDTQIGKMYVRNNFDKNVIKEVVDDHEYERWGDIKICIGDTIVDCGAHIGSFTRLSSLMGANVIAIEPDGENFEILKKNTTDLVNLKLVNALLFNGRKVPFKKDKERGELNKVDVVGDVMDSITLDELVDCFSIKSIDLLKMDIEGSEYEVLYNFNNIGIIKQLSMEWHYGATSMANLIIYLERHGFKVVWSAGNGEWGKIQAKRI
jgi:FkbM family methyltransferase